MFLADYKLSDHFRLCVFYPLFILLQHGHILHSTTTSLHHDHGCTHLIFFVDHDLASGISEQINLSHPSAPLEEPKFSVRLETLIIITNIIG